MCSFSGEKIILPIADPKKRFLLYICAVTITKGTDEQGKVFKDISLMGIGFSQTFEVDVCKVRPTDFVCSSAPEVSYVTEVAAEHAPPCVCITALTDFWRMSLKSWVCPAEVPTYYSRAAPCGRR